ncbi:ArnT family glycosyltransferase [uncultured Friedmanniella sp.]|uniref:ArnT family glycosyltransferase n=1 Tax=uncultured Friedmanniella sp. TaxID=335381 RepID=UPI0035C9A1CF
MSSPTLYSPAAAGPPSTVEPSSPASGRSGASAVVPARTRTGSLGRRLSLALLLVATAVLYLWHLSASGYANSFYSAAAQAGSESWKAFFYGSLDAGNAITVDKPPASLWLMALSVRAFGLSSWSILVPQALLGVATVGVLYASVRRTCSRVGLAGSPSTGHAAGLIAGALLAVTPVATLMFRFNNPDALLVFLLTLATYVTLRATEKASGRWLVLGGVLVGFAFLTKMLQAFLVLPAFVLVYLIAAPTTVRKRFVHLLAAFGAMIVSLGWWVAILELVPASLRPYVGGSTNDSILDLVIGYNGLGRILGREASTILGTSAGQGGMFGVPSVTRLFDDVSGGMVSWLLPAALLLAVLGIVLRGRLPRTDPVRAALVVWTGWLLVTASTFSFMQGTYHDYYTVALAPAIAAVVAIGGHVLWTRRATRTARIGLTVTMAVTTGWAVVLLGRATGGYETLRWPVLAVGVLATTGLLVSHRLPRLLATVVLALSVVGAGAGPVAYAVNTAATPHSGGIVTAGPVSGGGFGGGAAGRGQGRGRVNGQQPGGVPGGGTAPGGGTFPGGGGFPSGGQTGRSQGGGGVGESATVSTELKTLLSTDADRYRWVAATTGSQGSATYQLATELPVMAIGGFTGSDPSPTLAQFQSYVAAGHIHYYVGGGNRGGPGGGDGTATEIASWVESQFTATSVGGVQVYDLNPTR